MKRKVITITVIKVIILLYVAVLLWVISITDAFAGITTSNTNILSSNIETKSIPPQWKPANGINLTKTDSDVLKFAGKQANSNWNYATRELSLQNLQPGAIYRLEGWMKVELLSESNYPPAFKIVSGDSKGKWIKDHVTFRYGMGRVGTWQKLWVDFIADRGVVGGSIAIDKGTSQSIAVTLYIRDVSLSKISDSIIFSKNTYVSDFKFYDVFWPFKKSDVIAYSSGTIENYKDYGVSFVPWGGYPRPDALSIEKFCKKIDDAQKVGTKIGAKIGTRTDFAGFIIGYSEDAVLSAQTKDLTGKAFIVPDSPNLTVKGHPAYWFSTNNTTFQAYLKNNAERAIRCKPYGLMMDDPLGDAAIVLWHDGEYSNNSIHGFRNYLMSNFTAAQLEQNGISDIVTFDIKEYHQAYSQLSKENRPLRKELVDFQLKSSSEMFKDVTSYALGKLGQRVPVGGNIDPTAPYSGYLLINVDYYSFECAMNAKSGNPNNGRSLFSYKIADALQRPAVIMGSGEDHAFVQDNNLPGMIRAWVAEAYAFGNYFSAPYYLWAYKNGVSYSYQPRSSQEFAPLYQFIKNHGSLFDDYSTVSKTALVLAYKNYAQYQTQIVSLTKKLADESIPFDVVIAGDDVLGLHLSVSQLKKYDNLIVPDYGLLSVDDITVINDSGKTIVNNVDYLDISSQLKIKGATGIRATLRAVKNDNTKPVVVHLLNGDYDVITDTCSGKHKFVVSIPKILLKNIVTKVKYVRPPSWSTRALSVTRNYPDAELVFTSTDDTIEISVPLLDVWGILVLS